MNRKHNPLLSLVAMLLLAAILALTCIGCEDVEATTETADTKRFVVSEHEHLTSILSALVVTDTETGAQYLLVSSAYGAAITKLEEAPKE